MNISPQSMPLRAAMQAPAMAANPSQSGCVTTGDALAKINLQSNPPKNPLYLELENYDVKGKKFNA